MMEGLYQTPPVMYPVNNYHSTSPSHRPNDMYDYRRHSYGTNFHDTILPGASQPIQNWNPMPELLANSPSPPPSSSAPPLMSGYPFYSMNDTTLPPPPSSVPRPRLTTNIWEDEGTLCYQIDAKGICVARRQDNDMINGTKLLNVVGMSRGKRDGILKNEKGRVVVKVGAMHLKGVWITFYRAKELSAKFKVLDLLYPLFEEDPSIYLCTFNDKNPSTSRYMDYLRQKHPQSSPTTSPTSSSFHPKMGLNLSLNHETTNKHMYNEPSEGYHRHVSDTEAYLMNGPGRHHRHNYYHNHSLSHTNRSSFSSISSHHSHMYALQHETDDTSKDSSATTPSSYMETPHSFFVPVTNDEHGSFFSNKLPDITTAINDNTDPFTVAGPGTPSSWFSPEPLYHQQQQQQQNLESEDTFEKERRRSSSSSLHSLASEQKQKASTTVNGRSRKGASKKLKGGSSKI